MRGLLQLFKGCLRISAEGGQTERFLNLCRCQKISLFEVKRTEEQKIIATLYRKDFFKLLPIRRKTGVKIHILNKKGLPFWIHKNRRRKSFFAGLFLCGGLLFLLSGRVWNIHIEGNIQYADPEILDFLKENGIVHGMAKRKVDCSEIAASLRRNYPEITWVSAKLSGTRLLLTVQEGTKQKEKQTGLSPCDLKAETEGEIVKMITRAGTPLVKTGDVCKPGDILVSGKVPIVNDSQEIVRESYVHADADIYIRHSVSYYHEFPLACEKEIPEEKIRKTYGLRLGNWYASLYGGAEKGWKTVTEEIPLRITENFCLPVSLYSFTSTQYRKVKSVHTKEEAKQLAEKKLHLFEKKLMEKGVQISENNVKIDVNHTVCTSSGKLVVIEKTGMEAPVQQEEEKERTAVDGEQRN